MAKKTEATVEEKLRALYDLQLIHSRVDTIRNVRGELPLEVEDLEDEVAGLNTRLDKLGGELSLIDDQIKAKKILIEVLSRGDVKSLGISKLPRKPARRIDFMFTPKKEHAFAILYFTGSKAFNTGMRAKALKLGYSMNEHGMYKMVNGKTYVWGK